MLLTPSVGLVTSLIADEDSDPFSVVQSGTYKDVQRFIQADNARKIENILEEYTSFFDSETDEIFVKDVQDIRSVLLIIFELQLLCQKNKLCVEDFQGLPIELYEFNTLDELKANAEVKNYITELDAGNESFIPYFKKSFDLGRTLVCGVFSIAIESSGYLKILEEGIRYAELIGFSCELIRGKKENVLEIFVRSFNYYGVEGFRNEIYELIDALYTIHLNDVHTYTNNGILVQEAHTLVSSLWYSTAEAFRGGRPGKCKVCGNPFVAFGERGNKRLYCGQACNKKNQRLKRFKNLIDKGYKQEEASKLAKIRLKDGLEFIENITSSH